MAGNESKIPVGQILVGKYRVLREIGRGGMAAVYECEQLSLSKKVAVKVLAAELAASTIVIERFFREARAAASVRSPYIVDVYDSGRLDDGRPYIAMEMLEGESLYDRMARVRIIDVDTTIRVIVHSAKGLMKAHGAGIVHRDLKPENIFLTHGEDGDDVCKILDFGLAKFYAPVNPEDKAQKRLTREGAVFGTPAYMSPEQVKGQGNVDHRADLWALGCMAFECLIGRPVWNMDQGVAMTFASIATGPIPVPSQIRADLPKEFDDWFAKCLERDPANRYQSAKELSDAFIRAWGHRPVSSSQSFPHIFPATTGEHRSAAAGGDVNAETALAEGSGARRPPAAPSSRRQVNGNGRASGLDDSGAIPLVGRTSTEVPPTSQVDTPLPRSTTSPVRLAVSAAFLAASVSMALFVWIRFLSPQVFTKVVPSTASGSPSGSASAAPMEEPKWVLSIAEGQRLFSANPAEAQKKFQDVISQGAPGAIVAKVFLEQNKIATAGNNGPCKVVSFAHPRTIWNVRAERPSVLATSKGMLVTWTDDHEIKDKDHVWGVMLDGTGRSTGSIHDLTPEAASADRPQLVSGAADRPILLWWDSKGAEAGVHARFLDGAGFIDSSQGKSVKVSATRPGDYWPSIEKRTDGSGYLVAWQDDRDGKDNKDYDLFLRRLSNDLEPVGPETRLTDYHSKARSGAPRARLPAIAIAPSTLLVAFRYDDDKEKKHLIERMRIPLEDIEKQNPGLAPSNDPNRSSRTFGDVVPIGDDKLVGDAPSIACGKDGCFAAWHGEPSGVWIAYIDASGGNPQWKKQISVKGGHPTLAVNNGQVAIAFYEAGAKGETGRIKLAPVSAREGVGTVSTLMYVQDTARPRPSLAPGADGAEWAMAWQDSDVPKGPSEIYAARISCK
ncbi:MAG TPA: serine/threonine-protein kinase [Labilithrix sp.]